MNTDILSTLNDQSQKLLSSLQKLNKAAVAEVEKLAQHQVASLQVYSDLYVSNLKAAAEVNDLQDLQAFVNKQGDLAMTFGKRIATDAKDIAQMGAGFLAEAQRIAQESVTAATAKAL